MTWRKPMIQGQNWYGLILAGDNIPSVACIPVLKELPPGSQESCVEQVCMDKHW